MKRTPILICCDAGEAGRALLARRDIELRWALTASEALAAMARSPKPATCLMREDFALEVLFAARSADLLPPSIVLIEPDGWQRRETYFDAGATAMVQASSAQRILEAVSSITGLSFRQVPRVPYSTVVDVCEGGRRHFLEVMDLSVTGTAIRGVPEALTIIGERAELNFMMMDPPFVAGGVVARVFEEHGETVAVFNFDVISGPDRARLAQVVAEEMAREPQLPEPVGLTGDLSGTFTVDLVEELRQGDDSAQIYRNMLVEWLGAGSKVVRVPSWLERIGRALTALEKRALTEGAAHEAFARAAVDVRIRLQRMRVESKWPIDVECERTVEICRSLATDAQGAADEVLADVTQIRASLLRSAYGDPKNDGLEIVNVEVLDVDEPIDLDQIKIESQFTELPS